MSGLHRFLGWHTVVGDTGRRFAWLQLLWLGHTLLGGVVLGIFPATAAVHAVLRRDQMVADGWSGSSQRERLTREFHLAWRRELLPANALGLTLGALWVFVLVDHWLLRTVEISFGPALQVPLWILTVVLVAVSGVVWVLQSHFAEGPFALLRRSFVLVLARPLLAFPAAGVLAITACVYYVLPGLAVVFGIVAPAGVSMLLIWRAGVLPGPEAVVTSPTPAAPASAEHTTALA